MSNLSKTDIWYREEYLPFVDSHIKGVARCDTWDSYKEACIKRDEEIDKLKKQNEIYREALEFYADSDN